MVESLDSDPRLEPLSRAVMKQLGIKSIAIIPLVVDGNLRGGVGLDIYDESRSVTSSMIETATNITAHLSVALRTQELLRDTRQAAEQLEAQVNIQRALNQLSQIVNRAEDEVTLFDATMEAMFKLLKVDHAGLVMLDETSTWGTVVSDYPSQGVLGLKFEVAKNPLLMMMTSQEKAETIVIDDIETSSLLMTLKPAIYLTKPGVPRFVKLEHVHCCSYRSSSRANWSVRSGWIILRVVRTSRPR